MKLYVPALALFVLVSAGTALADPRGLWLAQDGAHVKVGPCGAALCATIASPKSAVDPSRNRSRSAMIESRNSSSVIFSGSTGVSSISKKIP